MAGNESSTTISRKLWDVRQEIMGKSSFTLRSRDVPNVTHEQVHKRLSEIGLGDLVLRKGQILRPDPSRGSDFPGMSTNQPPVGVSISSWGTRKADTWQAHISTTLWY